MDKRRLVIGDIHSSYKALVQVLERANYNPEKDILFFLGDYIDGWSECVETLDKLTELQEKGECVFLMGNHDKWMLDWLKFGAINPGWIKNGGKVTFSKLIQQPVSKISKYRKFFKSFHNYYITDDNIALVHGGYTSSKGLGHEADQSNYYWDRSLVKIAMSCKKQDSSARIMQKHHKIFIGHTSTVNWKTDQPIVSHNLYNIDTGAGWYGKLTAYDMDTNEYWQSDLVQELYKNEKGR